MIPSSPHSPPSSEGGSSGSSSEAEDGSSGTRPYNSPLREAQTALTRELILDALAEAVNEEGSEEFTISDVAERAGVAVRTVYRHFPNRQALLEGLVDLVDRKMADAAGSEGELLVEKLESAEDLLEMIPWVYRQFEELAPYVRAIILTSAGGALRSSAQKERTSTFRRLLEEPLEELEPELREGTFALVRHLASGRTWFALREEFGLGGEESGRAVARAVRLLLEAD